MLPTDLPNMLPGRYNRTNALKRELARFATHAEQYGDAYLTDWLTSAVVAMKLQMPNGSVGGGAD